LRTFTLSIDLVQCRFERRSRGPRMGSLASIVHAWSYQGQ